MSNSATTWPRFPLLILQVVNKRAYVLKAYWSRIYSGVEMHINNNYLEYKLPDTKLYTASADKTTKYTTKSNS